LADAMDDGLKVEVLAEDEVVDDLLSVLLGCD
jgi:hypothetical protein